jgi:tripartite-type tricarboxylate transporter receptor subunit TctC
MRNSNILGRLAAKTACLVSAAALALSAAPVMAEYPEKPIKILVGFAAGGGADTLSRLVAKELEAELGQPVVIENKPGGGGVVMATGLSRAEADGYTIGMAVDATFSLAPLFGGQVKYGVGDFDYLTTVAALQNAIVTSSNSPFTSWDGMIAHGKAGNKISFASPSPATKMMIQYIAKAEGIDVKVVPVKGGGAAIKEVLGGHIDTAWSAGAHQAFLKGGDLSVLAAGGTQPLGLTPDVPTLLDLGYDHAVDGIFLFAAPKGIPEDRLNRLTEALYKAASAESVATLAQQKMGFPNVVLSPQETTDEVLRMVDVYEDLMAASAGKQ